MSEPNRNELKAEAMEQFEKWVLSCDHVCSGNCRRVGCNCQCGEWHLAEIPKGDEYKELFNEWLENQ